MGIALYRKYRPQAFADVVSQDHVKTTLLNAISLGKIGHAYIFVGARGIGKTTLARLFARAINCLEKSGPEPCGKCEACMSIMQNKALDLIEIDAASNRGIEEIRELREKVKFTPSRLKYKVFIIDEVHMLTKEAFNALLKTLEEPPEHVVFLLATTEPNKVLATIMSRCQRFDLKKLTVPELVSYMQKIADREGTAVQAEALELIARQSDGCARDAVSLFTQLTSYASGEISATLVKEVLGVTDLAAVADFVDAIISQNQAQGLEQLRQLVADGYDLDQFTKNLVEYFRKLMLVNAGVAAADPVLADLSAEQRQRLESQAKAVSIGAAVSFIKAFLEAQKNLGQSVYPQLPLELAFLEIFENNKLSSSPSLPPPAKAVLPNKVQSPPTSSRERPTSKLKKNAPTLSADAAGAAVAEKEVSQTSAGEVDLETIKSRWDKVVAEVMPVNHSLATFLRMGELCGKTGEYLEIAFRFRFHKEQVAEHKYRRIVESVMTKVYGQKVLLKCVVSDNLEKTSSKKLSPPVANVAAAPADVAEMAKNVFGGKLI
jgi:DNA polymerase III subunit gamma/tau